MENAVFKKFTKQLGGDFDFIYPTKGDVTSLLIKELVLERIPFVNINGYLLIKEKDYNIVNTLNKDVLNEQEKNFKEVDKEEILRKTLPQKAKETPVQQFSGLSPMMMSQLKDSLKGIPNLLIVTDTEAGELSVQKKNIFEKKGKSIGQAVLEYSFSKRLQTPDEQANIFKSKTKADNYIANHRTAANDYYITSDIDPSVFITIKKDGFTLNHWQTGVDGNKRVLDLKKSATEPDYKEELCKALFSFPDIRIFNTRQELSSFITKKKNPLVSISLLRMNKCSKALAKQVNKMIMTADRQGLSLDSYVDEAKRILANTSNPNALPGYEAEDIKKIIKILERYKAMEKLPALQNVKIPIYNSETLLKEETNERSTGERTDGKEK